MVRYSFGLLLSWNPSRRRGDPRLRESLPGRPGSRAIDAGFGKPPCFDVFPFPFKQGEVDFEGDPPYDDPEQEDRGGGDPPYKDVGADEARPKADDSLQDLIDRAQDGDEILFPPGTVEERITIIDKSLVIRAAVEDPQNPGALIPGGHPFDHVIRAPDDGLDQSVVTIDGGPATQVILEGFTVTGGRAPAGGGASIRGAATVELTRCIVFDNESLGAGGGIIVEPQASLILTSSGILANRARTFGGGLLVLGQEQGAPFVMVNCTVSANESPGPAVRLEGFSCWSR